MIYLAQYKSPLGKMLMAADKKGLIGLWFLGQKYYGSTIANEATEQKPDLSIFLETKAYLDRYFKGEKPKKLPLLHLLGTDFQNLVWQELLGIGYGKTTTYGSLGESIAKKKGLEQMSAQAIGGAVGRNPVSILVPCHRVIGKNGSLTGYAGGTEKKALLLALEQKNINLREKEKKRAEIFNFVSKISGNSEIG